MICRVSLVVLLSVLAACGGASLEPWHTVHLDEEFAADRLEEVDSFESYLALEERLFEQLDREVYAGGATGPVDGLNRYSGGSAADPRLWKPNWNRSFELIPEQPIGGVLLLHGMSDSPYSLRSLGNKLFRKGYRVLGLRLPGHGTVPAGLTGVSWQDMYAAVQLATHHLSSRIDEKPLHIVGYSTGAPLALIYALDAEQGDVSPMPASLVLLSPAIGVSPAAALATWKRRLSLLPGLEQLAWLSIEPEFDPYKYNSFATNAGEQVYRLTRSLARRLSQRRESGVQTLLPPVLVLKSTVDATVSTSAVVDRLLMQLAAQRHELVLFDINRLAIAAPLLISDPGPLTQRLLTNDELPFSLTLVGNDHEGSAAVVARHRAPFSTDTVNTSQLDLEWPRGILSLSHVALPFSPDDSVYGRNPPVDSNRVFLGDIPLRGERGLLRISSDWLLRLRHNPFYDYLEHRTLNWVSEHQGSTR